MAITNDLNKLKANIAGSPGAHRLAGSESKDRY